MQLKDDEINNKRAKEISNIKRDLSLVLFSSIFHTFIKNFSDENNYR
jgi:hypothetical protein